MNKEVLEYFNNLPEVIRLKEIEPYIEGSTRIKNQFELIKDIQKKMVNAKEYNQNNEYQALMNEYELKKNELLDIPFVEEYLELVDYLNNKLLEFSTTVEEILSKKINE